MVIIIVIIIKCFRYESVFLRYDRNSGFQFISSLFKCELWCKNTLEEFEPQNEDGFGLTLVA